MKTNQQELPIADCQLPIKGQGGSAGFPARRRTGLSRPVFPLTGNWGLESPQNPQTGMSALRGTPIANHDASSVNRKSQIVNASAFTLIELLTVIAVMGVLAALLLPVVGGIARTKYRNIATAEMNQIENALEDFKAKYGVYPPSNANPTGTYAQPQTNADFPQLYYELSGVTNNGTVYKTLDGAAQIQNNNTPPNTDVQKAFGVGGFINCCSQAGGDDATPARNFLPGLKQNRIATVQDNNVWITNLVTTVNGPDPGYMPLGVANVNPFRYVYPGVNNPNSYDLYVVLRISGQTNLICNWSKSVILNHPMP